jgi:phosphatidate cytidylyltransferase
MKRIATALVLIPVVVWIVLAAPYWVFVAALAVIGLLAFHEFDHIAAAQNLAPAGWPGMAAGMALLLIPEPFVTAIVIVLVAMTLALREADLARALPGAAVFVLGVFYIFGAWRCAMGLREINPHLLMLALLVGWAGDTAAMYAGKAFGKHKLAPVVSPGKTVEGAVGSIAGSIIAVVAYTHFLLPDVPISGAVILGVAANVAGQIGDLCESAFKRGADLKDSGTMLPGHGGWLDRIDSSLFTVPVVYALAMFARGYVHIQL